MKMVKRKTPKKGIHFKVLVFVMIEKNRNNIF